MKLKSLLLSVLVCGAAGFSSAQAAEPSTLNRIAERNAVHLGYRQADVPFTFSDEQGAVQGYHWDLCLRIVDSIQERVGGDKLRVVPVPVTNTSRSLMLSSGQVDLDCSATPNTVTAQKQITFGMTTFVGSLRVMVKKDSGIKDTASLARKKVALMAGSGTERFLKTGNLLQGSTVSYIPVYSAAQAMELLEAGRVDGIMMTDVSLATVLAGAKDRSQYVMIGDALAFEPMSMAVRRDDREMKRLMDDVLVALMRNGELAKSYNRWFTTPIPPEGKSLDLPMGELLRRLLEMPNDQGV